MKYNNIVFQQYIKDNIFKTYHNIVQIFADVVQNWYICTTNI